MITSLPIINGIGALALVSISYGVVQRMHLHRWVRHSILGLIFGVGASYAMMVPVVLESGATLETQNLLIAYAAFFTGPIGAAVSILIAGSARMMLETLVSVTDVTALVSAAVIGLVWNTPTLRPKELRLRHCAFMGLQISLPLVVFLAPMVAGQPNVGLIFAGYVASNVFAATVFGLFLAREQRLAKRERTLQADVEHDFLTKVLNRRGFDKKYTKLVGNVQRGEGAVLMIDLDHFKSINDTFGHAVGDEVLMDAATAISQSVRKNDLVARMGGEEFAVYLHGASEDEAQYIAERIRRTITATVLIPDQPHYRVSASIGGMHFDQRVPALHDALDVADRRLYVAKENGRDRTVMRPRGFVPALAA